MATRCGGVSPAACHCVNPTVGAADHPHLAVGPRLGGGPFDRVVAVGRLLPHGVELASRAVAPAGVLVQQHVAARGEVAADGRVRSRCRGSASGGCRGSAAGSRETAPRPGGRYTSVAQLDPVAHRRLLESGRLRHPDRRSGCSAAPTPQGPCPQSPEPARPPGWRSSGPVTRCVSMLPPHCQGTDSPARAPGAYPPVRQHRTFAFSRRRPPAQKGSPRTPYPTAPRRPRLGPSSWAPPTAPSTGPARRPDRPAPDRDRSRRSPRTAPPRSERRGRRRRCGAPARRSPR